MTDDSGATHFSYNFPELEDDDITASLAFAADYLESMELLLGG